MFFPSRHRSGLKPAEAGFSRSGTPASGTACTRRLLLPAPCRRSALRTAPVHGPNACEKRKEALHEPARPSICSLPWESGAEDARTPNATAWSADSAGSAKRLECVRFIGAFRPARDGQRFMVPMHGRKAEGAFHEPTVRSPGFSRFGPPEGGTPNKWCPHGLVYGPDAYGKNERSLSMNRNAAMVTGANALRSR